MTTYLCTACPAPADSVLEYTRANSRMATTPFCSVHACALMREIKPITNREIETFRYQRLPRAAA